MDLLGTFADLAELSRNLPADEERHTELRVHSSREHFHTYLQSLDVERGGLPEQFRERLLRVLHHYGVEDLDRTPPWRRASSGSSWPSSARRPRSRWRPQCWGAGSPSRRRPASSRAGPGSCSNGSVGPPSCGSR